MVLLALLYGIVCIFVLHKVNAFIIIKINCFYTDFILFLNTLSAHINIYRMGKILERYVSILTHNTIPLELKLLVDFQKIYFYFYE